jgi:hypothetical protein
MHIRIQHDRLQNLALEAIGKYTSDICLQLLKLSRSRENDGNKPNNALRICKMLQDMFHSMVPPALANEITAELLKCIDNQSSDIRQWSKEPWTEEILQELICAIIHPSVTTVELSSDPQHIFPFGFKWNFLVPLVFSRLHTLKKLKVLLLGRPQCEGWIVDSVRVSEVLEDFTLIHKCSDKMLADLAESCKSLKRLDVSDSRKVTDASIGTILKVRHLEVLNVIGTYISELGLTRLLVGLAEEETGKNSKCRPRQLRCFGCSYITSYQLTLLAKNFPNLIEVRLSHCGVYDLSQLKLLTHLKKLSLSSIKFGQIQELLSELGNQLLYLDLRHIQSIDVRFIGEKCLVLRCFHLFSYGVLQPSLEHYNRQLLPGFQSVVCLEFDCDWSREWTEYILSQCMNVRKVDVTSHRRDAYVLLKQVLLRNPMKRLEQLHWSPGSPDGESIAKQLADQCPCLAKVKGLCKNKMNYRGVQLLC